MSDRLSLTTLRKHMQVTVGNPQVCARLTIFSAPETPRPPPVPSIGVGQRLGLLKVQDRFRVFLVLVSTGAEDGYCPNSPRLHCLQGPDYANINADADVFSECGGQVGAAFENTSGTVRVCAPTSRLGWDFE